jgi:hypothetical protein
MLERRKLRFLSVVFVTLASCSTVDGGTSTSEQPSASEPADSTFASSVTSSPPTTSAPTTTAETEATTSTTEPTIDLVVVGDSFVGWSEWPEMYAALASDALGISVVLNQSLAGPGTPRRLDQLLESESARDLIASADILVVQPQPGWAAGPAFNSYFNGECGGETNTDCLVALADKFRAYTDEYFDVLLDLVEPGTIVRVTNTATWAPEGFYSTLREEDPDTLFRFIDAVAAMMKESEEAAEERNIPVIDVSAAFNGPDYHTPAPDDFLVADRLHLAEKGSEVVAELLQQLGYQPTIPGQPRT